MTLNHSTQVKSHNVSENFEIQEWCTREFGQRMSLDNKIGHWNYRWSGVAWNDEVEGHISVFTWSFKTEEQLLLFTLRWL